MWPDDVVSWLARSCMRSIGPALDLVATCSEGAARLLVDPDGQDRRRRDPELGGVLVGRQRVEGLDHDVPLPAPTPSACTRIPSHSQ